MSQTAEYKNKFAISQSAIKDWEAMSPKKWQETWILKTRPRPKVGASAGFGSLVDCLVFTPNLLEKRFLVSDTPLPSESIQKVVGSVYERLKELNANAATVNSELAKGETPVPMREMILDHQDLIETFSKEHEYYATQPKRAYDETLKKGTEYFEFLKNLNGRTVTTAQDLELAKKLTNILQTNPLVKGFFVPNKNCEVVFQQNIFATIDMPGYENLDFLPLKGAIDDIYFNHKKKEVREIDLKWTNDAFMFKDVVKRFGYVKQHSFYDHLLREWLKTYKDGAYADYYVANPLNVVIDSDEKTPYIYQYNANDLHIERYGHENMHWFKGWEQTLHEIAWHMDTQQWDRPKEHYKNGFMNVQFFKR